MVPGSTLIYGSIWRKVSFTPRASSKAPSSAAARPLPSEETTPPVTKMNLVLLCLSTPGLPAYRLPRKTLGLGQILRSIYLKRRRHGSCDADGVAIFQRAQLFQHLDPFENPRPQMGELPQKATPVGINPN